MVGPSLSNVPFIGVKPMRLVLLLILTGSSLSAQDFQNCSGLEDGILEDIERTRIITSNAFDNVGDNEDFVEYLSDATKENTGRVSEVLSSVISALSIGVAEFSCMSETNTNCSGGTFAYVYSDTPYEVALCPAYFDLPALTDGSPFDPYWEYGTREGKLLHEFSHFEITGGTEDGFDLDDDGTISEDEKVYGRSRCRDFAEQYVNLNVEIADCYQYFAEDVTPLVLLP